MHISVFKGWGNSFKQHSHYRKESIPHYFLLLAFSEGLGRQRHYLLKTEHLAH